MPNGNFSCLIDWVKSSNFISWLLYNQCLCTQLVKRSIRVVKVIICYIDSDQKDILNIKKRFPSYQTLGVFWTYSYAHDYFVMSILTTYDFLILKLYLKQVLCAAKRLLHLLFCVLIINKRGVMNTSFSGRYAKKEIDCMWVCYEAPPCSAKFELS